MAHQLSAPRYCIQHSRFPKQDGWRLNDLSLSLNGNIAATGYNIKTHRTYIVAHSTVRHSDFRNKPKILYSSELEMYESEGKRYRGRRLSFYPGSDTTILSGLGDKLEVIDLIKDRVIKSRKIKLVKHGDLSGQIQCLSVKETEIFIGFRNKSNKLIVYCVMDLSEIKSIILQGIQDGFYPYDMTAISDRIFVCVGDGKEGNNYKTLIFEEKNGRILSELTKPTDSETWYVTGAGVNTNTSGIAAVVWKDLYLFNESMQRRIVFYSLLDENYCSFLIVEAENGVTRIRISDRGDMIVTGNVLTGEVKVYDMSEVFTYNHFKEKLASTLQTDECTELANFFSLSKDKSVPEELLLALEDRNVSQLHNVERLIKAFGLVRINPFCLNLADLFLKTRSPNFYREVIMKLEEEIKIVQRKSDEDRRQLKEKPAGIESIQKELKTLQEVKGNQSLTKEKDKFQARFRANQLKLSSLEEELKTIKDSSAHSEELLRRKTQHNNVLQEKLDQCQRKMDSLQLLCQNSKQKHEETVEIFNKTKDQNKSMALEIKTLKTEREKFRLEISRLQGQLQANKNTKNESEKVLKQTKKQDPQKDSASAEDDALTSRAATVKNKYLPESVLEEKFAKFLVKVSINLKNSNCVLVANFFNLPESKIDSLQKESETAGLTLLRVLKERNIINMYDVTHLQEVLTVLGLLEINETLVVPYQNGIDPSLYQRNKIVRKEHSE